MESPTISELKLAVQDCRHEEHNDCSGSYEFFSNELQEAISDSKVLEGTIFMPGSFALGVEIGMRIQRARQEQQTNG